MKQQVVTPALRHWIIEQAKAGCRPEDVLASMRNSGWQEDVALEAFEATLRDHLVSQGQAEVSALPPAVPVPEPALSDSPST